MKVIPQSTAQLTLRVLCPQIALADGGVLAESNAILLYLAHGTQYLPSDPSQQAKVLDKVYPYSIDAHSYKEL